MDYLRLYNLTFISILFFVACNQIGSNEEELINALDSTNIDISIMGEDSCNDSRLKALLRNKRIIGLGEATHGTHDFFKLRCQFSRFLILELDYKIIAIEAGFQECIDLNNYVTYGIGDPNKLLQGLHQWFWQREEMLVFIEWLKKYNEGKDEDECVQFYGFDMQWRRASGEALVSYLSQTNFELYDKYKKELFKICNTENEPLGDSIYHIIREIEQNIIHNEIKYLNQSSKRGYEIVLQNIQILKQAEPFLKDRSEIRLDYEEIRDKFMAENLIWINDLNPKDKIIIWAHNGHISKGERCGVLSIICEKTMGNILKKNYGDDYYPIGFEFNRGTFMAFHNREKIKPIFLSRASKNSLAYFLSKAKSDNCIIDFELLINTSEIGEKFLNSAIKTHSIGTNYYEGHRYTKKKLKDHFDALIFIEYSTPMIFLK